MCSKRLEKISISAAKGKRHKHTNDTTRVFYWESEIVVLKSMYQEKYPICRIAEVLNREVEQVSKKIKHMQKRGLI
ncbi:hypothetical protein CS557_12720 [Acinetobacter junii]|nr:hypothetical protein CS557_12720 [Acinetobacter junii]